MRIQHPKPEMITIISIAMLFLSSTGCSPTQKGTALPSPTSAIPAIISALLPVVNGQGVPEAAAYDSHAPGPHPMVILSTSGLPYKDWNDDDPYGWISTSLSETELVVMIGEEREKEWSQQAYNIGPNITAFVYEVDLELREARTGKILATTTYKGALPPWFPYSAPIEQTRIEGSHLSHEGLETWLCPHVVLQGCWKAVRSFKGVNESSDSIQRLAFSKDGKNLAYGTFEGGVGILRVADGSRSVAMKGHNDIVYGLAFSLDGAILASSSLKEGAFFWSVTDGSLLHGLEGPLDSMDSMKSLAFSPNGQILASGSMNDNVQLWRVADGSQMDKPKGHASVGSDVAFSPDGLTLAAGAGASYDHSIILWQVSDGKKLRTLETDRYGVESVAFSPDGGMLASGSVEGVIQLWQPSDGSLLLTITGPAVPVVNMAFTPDGQTLLVIYDDDTLRSWNVADGSLIRSLEINTANWMAISPDGKTLAVAGWDGITLWQYQ
jgi:WD40 repeat protein